MPTFCRLFTFTVPFLIFLAASQTSAAQQTTPDSLLRQQAQQDSIRKAKAFFRPDLLKYRFYTDGNFAMGNVTRDLLVLRAEMDYSGPVVSWATHPRFAYGRQNGVLAERDFYVDLFIDIYKQHKIYTFGLGTIETSNLRKIVLRQLAGAGVGFRLWETPENSLVLTNAVLFESTDFRERATVETLRNSARLKGKHSFFKNRFRLTHITFLQPSIQNWANFRWSTNIALELPLNKWISFRTGFENTYESIVEATRQRNDSRLTVGLSIGNK